MERPSQSPKVSFPPLSFITIIMPATYGPVFFLHIQVRLQRLFQRAPLHRPHQTRATRAVHDQKERSRLLVHLRLHPVGAVRQLRLPALPRLHLRRRDPAFRCLDQVPGLIHRCRWAGARHAHSAQL